jgi:hypothetical protein
VSFRSKFTRLVHAAVEISCYRRLQDASCLIPQQQKNHLFVIVEVLRDFQPALPARTK